MNEQKHTGGQKPVCVTHEKLLSEGTRQSFTEPSRESVSYTHIQPHTHMPRGRVGDHGGSGVVFYRRPFTHPHRSTVACIRSCTHTQTAIRSREWASFTHKPLSLFSIVTLSLVRSLQSKLEHSCYSVRDIWIEYYPLNTLSNQQKK